MRYEFRTIRSESSVSFICIHIGRPTSTTDALSFAERIHSSSACACAALSAGFEGIYLCNNIPLPSTNADICSKFCNFRPNSYHIKLGTEEIRGAVAGAVRVSTLTVMAR